MWPAPVLSTFLYVWLAAVAALVLFRMLQGKIHTDGLLRSAPNAPIDPERLQMLAGAVAGAVFYASYAMQVAAQSDTPITSLPDVPDTVLVLLSGSQFLYLGGKLGRKIKDGA